MGMLGPQKLSRESARPPGLWNFITANFRVQFIATSPFSVKKPLYTFCLAPNGHVDTLRGSLANLLEHLAAKKPEKASWEMVKKNSKNRAEETETWLQIAKCGSNNWKKNCFERIKMIPVKSETVLSCRDY